MFRVASPTGQFFGSCTLAHDRAGRAGENWRTLVSKFPVCQVRCFQWLPAAKGLMVIIIAIILISQKVMHICATSYLLRTLMYLIYYKMKISKGRLSKQAIPSRSLFLILMDMRGHMNDLSIIQKCFWNTKPENKSDRIQKSEYV